ncbi:MAG: cell division protein FtsW [Marinilabiliaceae bacterium]|nr:cell division protein FtsW [Marinilabiliaceae bacterium]
MKLLLERHLKGDRIIWGLIFLLSVFSLLAVYSSTGTLAYKYHGGNTTFYMFKHLSFLIIGLTVTVFIHKMHYRFFARIAVVFLWVSIGLLLLALVSGMNLNEASRWIKVPGIGISFQPSELAKFALIIYIARVLSQNQEEGVPARKAFKPIMVYVGFVCGLIFTENLSTAGMIGFASMTMMFIGRVPFKYLLGTMGVVIGIIAIVFLISPYVSVFHRAETWKARVERFVNNDNESESDLGGDYQSQQAKMAVATGGFIGKGPGNSYQRNFLPHPYSDFIYAIIVEEFGFFGGFLILLAYMILLFRAALLVKSSQRTFPAFLAMGLTFILVLQAFINMGVAVGVFPVTGQPLPLVSMGGTSIIFTCAAFGAILSVSRCNIEEKKVITEAQNTTEEGTTNKNEQGDDLSGNEIKNLYNRI